MAKKKKKKKNHDGMGLRLRDPVDARGRQDRRDEDASPTSGSTRPTRAAPVRRDVRRARRRPVSRASARSTRSSPRAASARATSSSSSPPTRRAALFSLLAPPQAAQAEGAEQAEEAEQAEQAEEAALSEKAGHGAHGEPERRRRACTPETKTARVGQRHQARGAIRGVRRLIAAGAPEAARQRSFSERCSKGYTRASGLTRMQRAQSVGFYFAAQCLEHEQEVDPRPRGDLSCVSCGGSQRRAL